jgi:hypothetical protein
MMKVLELLAIKADMLKIMATIFKNDKPEVILCSLLFSTVGKRERDRNFFLDPDPEISQLLFRRALKKSPQSINESWMRSSRVVRASDCQCRSSNSPGFGPCILRHSAI